MNKNAFQHLQSKRSANSLFQRSWSAMIAACPLEAQPLSSLQLRRQIKEQAHQKNYIAALCLLNQLIARHADSAIDYNNRGLMYLKLGKYDQAMRDFDYAIALNPNLDRVYNNRANCQAIQGNLVEAIADYEMALDINPYNQRVWINQGITLRELGDYETALETLEIALIVGEQHQGRIYAERGYTHYLNGDWNWAIGDFRRALSNLPETDHYHQKIDRWLGQILQPLV